MFNFGFTFKNKFQYRFTCLALTLALIENVDTNTSKGVKHLYVHVFC